MFGWKKNLNNKNIIVDPQENNIIISEIALKTVHKKNIILRKDSFFFKNDKKGKQNDEEMLNIKCEYI
jgi:hypothetical protein